jgi:hypothetical protein
MAYILDDNGNYKRSVRCSWCYEVGHSQRACPQRYPDGTPAQQRKAQEAKDLEARKLLRESRRADKAAGVKVAKVPRKCGYCKEYGHIRRKCEVLATDKTRLGDAILDYRNKVVDEIVTNGIGPGALVITTVNEYDSARGGYHDRNHYRMIRKVDITGMDPHMNWKIGKREEYDMYATKTPLRVLNLSGDRNVIGRTDTGYLPGDSKDEESFAYEAHSKWRHRTGDNMRVVYPGEVSLPDDFLDRDLIDAEVDAYFKTTKTREHYNIVGRLDHIDLYKAEIKEYQR